MSNATYMPNVRIVAFDEMQDTYFVGLVGQHVDDCTHVGSLADVQADSSYTRLPTGYVSDYGFLVAHQPRA